MNLPLYLMGFMASGKSNLGAKLARRLELPFIDLDKRIEEVTGKTISQIFKEEGEVFFRDLEKRELQRIMTQKAIISLGGGTPCQEGNIEIIKRSGTSVYLNVSKNVLVGRLKRQKHKRPLVANLEGPELSQFVEIKLKEREPFYKQADFILTKDKAVPNDILNLLT